MNAADRKKVTALSERLSKLEDEANAIAEEIAELASAEREKFDNMTDGLQQGERGQAIEQAADALDTAASNAEEIGSSASSVKDELDSIE